MSLQQSRQKFSPSHLSIGGELVAVLRTGGTGCPVFLLPGAQGTAEVFHRQMLAWGDKLNMVGVTYPGLTDPAALADIVVGVADALGIARFDVIGSSYGGYIAQWLAARHPSRVRRVVVGNSFQNPAPSQSPDKLAAIEAKSADELKAEALGRLNASPESEFRTIMLDLVGEQQPAALLRSRMLAVQKATPVPTLGIDAQDMLLIECDNDPLISADMRAAIRAHYPAAKRCAISGGGHYPYLLKTAEYNHCVAAFLEVDEDNPKNAEPSGTKHYSRVAGPGIDMKPEDVMKNVALYNQLEPDPNAFVDKSTPGKRLPIKWVISSGNKAAPAGISTPHSFHMSFIESRAGNSPVIHAHEYREIFMPIRGRYRIYFNKNSEHHVELGPFDTFSVPPMLWRRVEQQGADGESGMILVIYDDVEDPNGGIYVPQEVIDADRASGVDPYAPAR